MKLNALYQSVLIALPIAFMAGCGLDNDASGNTIATEDGVRAQVEKTIAETWTFRNVDDSTLLPSTDPNLVSMNKVYEDCRYGKICTGGESITASGSVRYLVDDEQKINIYLNTDDGIDKALPQAVIEGMKIIQNTIGREIFTYKGVSQIPEVDSEDLDYSSITDSQGGFIISLDTTWNGDGSMTNCGTVSIGPNETGITSTVIDNKGFYQENKGWTWINLGGPGCGFDSEIVAHEFAHALGLDKHFDGFGDGDIFNNHAKSVLKTLYNNPPQIEADQMQIELVN